jgi:signal transduction histidine kinase
VGSRHEVAVNALLVAVVGGVGVLTAGPDGLAATPWQVVSLLLGVAGFVAVFWRSRARTAFGVVAVLIGAVSPVATYLPLIGVYTVASGRSWRHVAPVVVLALGGAVLTLTRGVPDPGTRITLIVGAFGMLLTATAFGLFVGTQRQLVAGLRERAERAEADQAERTERIRLAERRRIAGEMHDVLGHRLSLLSVHAGALELRPDLSPETVRSTAAVLRGATHEAMGDLRKIVLVLREPVGELGGIDQRREDLDAVVELVELARHAGTAVRLDLPAELRAEPPREALARTAYRVVREGLTNARRHAAGAPVAITVRGGDELVVEVASGRGRAESPPGSGTGLISLCERVEAVTGGTLEHGPTGDGGWSLRARMPWEDG